MRAAAGHDEAEDAHRLRALARLGEQDHDQRERDGRDDGAAEALHRARRDEELLRRREAARERGEREERDARRGTAGGGRTGRRAGRRAAGSRRRSAGRRSRPRRATSPRSRGRSRIDGSATFTIVVSRTIIRSPRQSTISASQRCGCRCRSVRGCASRARSSSLRLLRTGSRTLRPRPVRKIIGRETIAPAAAVASARAGRLHRRRSLRGPPLHGPRRSLPAQPTGRVVRTNAAWSGTSKRATPAAFVVTVPATEFVPSPLPFQSASVSGVFGGSPPMLYEDDSPFGAIERAPVGVEADDRQLAVGAVERRQLLLGRSRLRSRRSGVGRVVVRPRVDPEHLPAARGRLQQQLERVVRRVQRPAFLGRADHPVRLVRSSSGRRRPSRDPS